MLGLLHFDSFPALWLLVLHSWIALGFGQTDLSLRVLGFLIGLGVVGMILWTARQFRGGVPLISMVLFAMSPTVVLFGGEVRGYGLGVVCLLFVLGAMWNLTEDPAPWSIVAAVVAAVLAVQSAFGSSIFLFGFCLAGGIVALRNRRGASIGILLGVGAVAAASILPYLRTMARYGEWNMIVQSPIEISWFFRKFTEAVAGSPMVAVWIVLFVFSTGVCLRRAFRDDPSVSRRERDLALFLPVATAAGLIGFVAYLKTLSVPTQSWYYMPAMAILAVYFEAAVDMAVRRSVPGRVLRMVLVVAVGLLTVPEAWRGAHMRMTNLDRVAAEIASRCAPDDLVVLTPWYAGVTFERYYRGKAPWVSVPDFEERRFQPYPDFKRKMTEREPIRPVLERIGRTLESGHKIWLVNGLPFLPEGQRPEALPPAPHAPVGWSLGAYEWAWVRQAAYFVQTHATRLESIPVPVEGPVNPFENLTLEVIGGWRRAEGSQP